MRGIGFLEGIFWKLSMILGKDVFQDEKNEYLDRREGNIQKKKLERMDIIFATSRMVSEPLIQGTCRILKQRRKVTQKFPLSLAKRILEWKHGNGKHGLRLACILYGAGGLAGI